MIAENPAPDNDTMETLINTNEQLTKALSQHQRAVLSARKAAGTHTPPVSVTSETAPPPPRTDSGFAAPPPGPPPPQSNNHTSKPLFPSRKAVHYHHPSIPPPGDHAPPAASSYDSNSNSDSGGDGSGGGARSSLLRDRDREPISALSTTIPNPPFPSDVVSPATSTFRDDKGMEPWHPGFRETMGRGSGSGRGAEVRGGRAGASGYGEDEEELEEEEEEEGLSPIEGSSVGSGVHGKMPMYRY